MISGLAFFRRKNRTRLRGEIGAEAAQPEVRQRDVLSFGVGKDSRRPVCLLQNVDR